jgi:UDP-N-acetylglucosamine transferase subunit ALG13
MHAGRHPVLVARRRDSGEHVDDHQSLFAAALARRGLVTATTPGELSSDLLADAAARATTRPDDAPAFVLSTN